MLLIAAMQIGLPVQSFTQMLAVLSFELFVVSKNSRMAMSANSCHACIVQKPRFAVTFLIFWLVHVTICYHSIIEK